MDLVRHILLQVEAASESVGSGELDYLGHTQEEVYYHIDLMENRCLIDASIAREWGGRIVNASISGLTWDGQDLLDSMRDDRVWARAKKAVAASIGSTTFEVIKDLCTSIAADMAKRAAGLKV